MSPIVAALLLIVIAVAAAAVTYMFVMGFLGNTSGNTGPRGQLSYDSYAVAGVADADLVVYLRNTGGKAVELQSVYVDGAAYVRDSTPSDGEWLFKVGGAATLVLDVAQTGTLYVNTNGLNAAEWHTVRVVCTDGTSLEFSVRKQSEMGGQLYCINSSWCEPSPLANIGAYLRNNGAKSLTLSQVYVDGNEYDHSPGLPDGPDSGDWTFSIDGTPTVVLNIDEVGQLQVCDWGMDSSEAHTVRVVCTDGTALEFVVAPYP